MKKALQKSKVGPAETDAGGADAPAGDANSSAAAAAAAEPSDVDADAGAGGSSGAAALRPQGSPAKLPPLGQGGADGATYALTGGTFTLNGSPAHQRGVATFEFEALPDGSQLLVPPPTFGQEEEKQTAVVTADTSSAAATSAPKKDVDNPPPKAKVSEDTWTKGFLKACGTISIVVGVTLLGNFVFSGLESDGEEADRADYTAYMLAHKERYNISEEDFASLVDFVGTPIEFDPDSHDRNWGGTNRNSILFTFTIVSTIGYGNFAPSTDGGKIFLMFYAAVGIPLVGSAVGFLAAQFLGVLEWYAVLHMDVVQGAFEHYDEDESGWLCESEFYSALEDLEIHLTPKEVRRVMKNVDDEGDMRIELDEFKAIAAMLNLPLGKAARARMRLLISVVTAVLWLFVGSLAYVELEGWTYLDSVYFCVVTLTTIGLGDFVPSTKAGVTFHFFYCVIGLGLVAILLTAIWEFVAALQEEGKRLLALAGREELEAQAAAAAAAMARAGGVHDDDEAARADVARRQRASGKKELQRKKSRGLKGAYGAAASVGKKVQSAGKVLASEVKNTTNVGARGGGGAGAREKMEP